MVILDLVTHLLLFRLLDESRVYDTDRLHKPGHYHLQRFTKLAEMHILELEWKLIHDKF